MKKIQGELFDKFYHGFDNRVMEISEGLVYDLKRTDFGLGVEPEAWQDNKFNYSTTESLECAIYE